MRRDPHRQARALAQTIQPVAKTADPERVTGPVEEDLRRRGHTAAGSAFEQYGPAVLEVGAEGRARRTTQQPDPLLAALAQDTELAAAEIE